MAADAALLAQAGSLSQGLLAEGSLRRFTFSVDLNSFQASSRLPLNLASIVLELSLPPELAGAPPCPHLTPAARRRPRPLLHTRWQHSQSEQAYNAWPVHMQA